MQLAFPVYAFVNLCIILEFLVDGFDGNLSPQGQILGQIHIAHSALANSFKQLVAVCNRFQFGITVHAVISFCLIRIAVPKRHRLPRTSRDLAPEYRALCPN